MAGAVPGTQLVSIDTGGAMVDGKWFINDASENIAIPSAVGGGNTRIDRVVLRADWANFNVSAYRIAGTAAATPGTPAIVQATGTTYDIMLCRALVNTSGSVTLTDERVWATPQIDGTTIVNSVGSLMVPTGGINSAQIANDAILNSKIAAGAVGSVEIDDNQIDSQHYVDYSIDTVHIANYAVTAAKISTDTIDSTHIGGNIPCMEKRQGGSSTNWSTSGTANYTPESIRTQGGACTIEIANGQTKGYIDITFPAEFAYKPLVYVSQIDTGGNYADNIVPYTVTTTTVRIYAKRAGTAGADTFQCNWLAIGPE